jgi:hypothetical protein
VYEKRYPVPVIICQAYIPAPRIYSPVSAIIFGKFIYAPRSSHPIGIGLIAFMSDTLIKNVTIKNVISAESRRGERAERSDHPTL